MPDGLCECGCGQATNIAPRSSTLWGWVKGQPIRFRRGHASPVTRRQPTVKRYRHRKIGEKHIDVHRLRAEAALGHALPVGAVVHHADGSLRDDAPLVICQDTAYHKLLHRRM